MKEPPELNTERATFSAPPDIMQKAKNKAKKRKTKFSSYICDLVTKDLAGDIELPDIHNKEFAVKICELVHPTIVNELRNRLPANQPKLLANLLVAWINYVERRGSLDYDIAIVSGHRLAMLRQAVESHDVTAGYQIAARLLGNMKIDTLRGLRLTLGEMIGESSMTHAETDREGRLPKPISAKRQPETPRDSASEEPPQEAHGS